MEAHEEKKIGDYILKIFPDEPHDSPDDWGNDDVFVVFDHRDFSVERDGFKARDIWEYMMDNPNKVLYDGYHVIQCYAYIHSGVVLSVGDHCFPDARWDVSSTGFWLVKKQKGTWTREQALKSAEGLCTVWNQYLCGDVWGYEVCKITKCELNHEHETHIDSCWGYYGIESCRQEGTQTLEYHSKQ